MLTLSNNNHFQVEQVLLKKQVQQIKFSLYFNAKKNSKIRKTCEVDGNILGILNNSDCVVEQLFKT
jgi:hypothetical protein